MNIAKEYGKDTAELVSKIGLFIEDRCDHFSFSGKYTEDTGFYMTTIPHIGVFVVKFPDIPYVAIAGIDLSTGDYIFESKQFGEKTLNIFELKEMKIKSLVKMAEEEWSIETGKNRDNLDKKQVD